MQPLSQWDARAVPFGEGPEIIQNSGGGGGGWLMAIRGEGMSWVLRIRGKGWVVIKDKLWPDFGGGGLGKLSSIPSTFI